MMWRRRRDGDIQTATLVKTGAGSIYRELSVTATTLSAQWHFTVAVGLKGPPLGRL